MFASYGKVPEGLRPIVEVEGKTYEVIIASDRLESKTKAGLAKLWKGLIVKDNEDFFLITEFWQMKQNGEETKRQYSAPYQVHPKNVGRANETSAVEQAALEYESMIKKQRDKGYRAQNEAAPERPLPMLAHSADDKMHNVSWPAYIQPKLNGMRMLYNGSVAWSRGGKDILPTVMNHLHFDTEGYIVDGELILPGNPRFVYQDTMSAAKKFYPDISPTLTYQVYDVVAPGLAFDERYAILQRIIKNAPANVKLVQTFVIKNQNDVVTYHKQFVSEGYEGGMIRNARGKYLVGHRSSDLLKVKVFQDSEFPILGVEEGEGNDKGLAIFVCGSPVGRFFAKGQSMDRASLEQAFIDGENKIPFAFQYQSTDLVSMTEDYVTFKWHRQGQGEGYDVYQVFRCRPEGTNKYRAELWKNRQQHIGKWLTIRFFELTKEGKPQFPVGVGVREKEDFDDKA